jgi:hypothetical protein
MKVIIDFIEDVRESISNSQDFVLTAMLLKEDEHNSEKLIYAGESPIHSFSLDEKRKQLIFKIEGSEETLGMGELIPSLLILDINMMMYELRMSVNALHNDVEIIGFGKNIEERKYILFIKI